MVHHPVIAADNRDLKHRPSTMISSKSKPNAAAKFYKMRNASKTKQLAYPKDKEAPPLVSSNLRKSFRCDERTILDKTARASRMKAKLEHLRQTSQDCDNASTHSSDSSEDDCNDSHHVIHDLVETLVDRENRLSLQRENAKQLEATSTYKATVQQLWDEFKANTTGDDVLAGVEHDCAVTATDNDIDASSMNEMSRLTSTNIIRTTKHEETTDEPCVINGNNTRKVGARGIWRFHTAIPAPETQSISTLLAPSEVMYPEHLDTSQAVASYFHSKPTGSENGGRVKVLNRLAFKSPLLSPYCYASSQGFIVPPFAKHECVSGTIPHITLPGTSLMETKVSCSRLDALLRQPIKVMDPATTAKDCTHGSRSPNCLNEFDENGFRRMTFASAIEYDDTISPRAFGISSAIPNEPKVLPPITHTSHECCVEYLSRVRTKEDYHYIAESDGEGTHSEPRLFVTHMSGYHPRYVSKTSISEQKKHALEAKEAAAKKVKKDATALRLDKAEKLTSERFTQRVASIKDEVSMTKHFQPETAGESFNLSPNALNLTIKSQPDTEKSLDITPKRTLHNPIGKRSVVTGNREPILKPLNPNRSLATCRAAPTDYESQFRIKPQSIFIQDLMAERLKISRSIVNQQKTEDSVLNELQVPLTTAPATLQIRTDSIDPVTKAILAIKNHNLSVLEEVLDSEGDLDIDTRDQHGNTLFILACQQGSKKLAKFLLRRGSYINAQNHGGNTALHYLHEYSHKNMADWLVRKGADDTLVNAQGNTVYEGISCCESDTGR